ncbi:MAG: 2Fe-2S iron-sulfur cluster-binding protein [Vicinamibacterales bacterium]
MSSLYANLTRYTALDWRRAVDTLSAGIHEIDRDATRIWFAFFPLDLHLALETVRREGGEEGEAALARKLGLMGNWRLADQVDYSHRFLFAHRYWPQVKSAISGTTDLPEPLPALITAVADASTRTARVDRDLVLGMSAVGLMTLRQAGPDAFAAAPGQIHLSDRVRARSPHQVLKERARDDVQGVMGFLRGVRRRWTVTFDENEPEATFPVIEDQEVATAAQADKREYRSRDIRCTPGEGPIPVECRAASCGTCWVGVLGGASKLSPVVERDEGRRMKVFGYVDTDEPQPLIRLSCQARARGAVSIVIPPWNGIIGRRP